MIRVLIVEDNANKAGKVVSVLQEFAQCEFDTASDIVTARGYLKNDYDLMIIDLNLPERFNETPKENKGIEFLQELKKSSRLKFPSHVIGLTEYEDLFDKYHDEFSGQAIVLIKYDNKGIQWQDILKEQIRMIEKSDMQGKPFNKLIVDVAFIAALRVPELEELLKKEFNWAKYKTNDDPTIYFLGRMDLGDDKVISVVATSLPQMGMVAAATTTTKVISNFKPKYVIMLGICGGVKNAVKLGDVVLADLAFDMGSGKIIKNADGKEGFVPDFKPIPLDGEYKEEIIEFSTNNAVLDDIKRRWRGNKIDGSLNLIVGPIGSGAAVIANEDYTQKILDHQRKLAGIDMETYSVFYCCQYANNPKPKAFSIKGVCDYADQSKNDDLQKYCAFVSVEIAEYMVKNILKFE